MTNLDDGNAIKNLDLSNVLGSIEQLGEQTRQAWDDVHGLRFPDTYKNVTSIVFSGMGGSALGAYVNKSLFWDSLTVPFEIINDYHLPPYVNDKTLVILSTYSGTTEETLSCAQEALQKKACITGLTSGSKLGEFFSSHSLPGYIFVPSYNPSAQPRLGGGYSVVGLCAMLDILGFVTVDPKDIDEAIQILSLGKTHYGVSTPEKENIAKQFAQKWHQKIPIIVSARHLLHVGRVMRNQIHESAKTFSVYHDIPEMNHHLLEGLTNPTHNKDLLQFLFLLSRDYEDKIAKRMSITKTVLEKQGMSVNTFEAKGKSRLAQALECMQFGAYVNFYMAMLNDVDPSKIPWVDYFKKELAKE